MAKSVFVSFAWQDDPIPTPLTVEDNQTLREALRPLLPAGVTPDQIEGAMSKATAANVIDKRGSELKDGDEISISRKKVVPGGVASRIGYFSDTFR